MPAIKDTKGPKVCKFCLSGAPQTPPCEEASNGWLCTRRLGHKGDHVACTIPFCATGGHVLYRWPPKRKAKMQDEPLTDAGSPTENTEQVRRRLPQLTCSTVVSPGAYPIHEQFKKLVLLSNVGVPFVEVDVGKIVGLYQDWVKTKAECLAHTKTSSRFENEIVYLQTELERVREVAASQALAHLGKVSDLRQTIKVLKMALQECIKSFVTGENYETMNPHIRPCVITGVAALAEAEKE